MHPIKQEIIGQISKLITRSIPAVDIDVYGSHATQLCLHWSDIDLVVIPKPIPNNSTNNYNNGTSNYHTGYGHGNSHSNYSNIINGRHLLLEQVYEELRRDEHKGWITKV